MNKPLSMIKSVLAITMACYGLSLGAQEAATPEMETNAPPSWEVSADVGFTLTSGNSETMLATAAIIANKEWSKSRLELGIAGAYGEDTSIANVQTLRGWGQYDKDFAERWYWLARAELLHDGIAGIDYRLTLSPGVGYWIIRKEKTKLSAEGGISYVLEDRDGQQDYFALRLAERFSHDFNKRVRVAQEFEILPQLDDFENFYMNFRIGLESDLNDKLAMTLTFIDTYNNIPAAGRERNDIKFIAGLKYRF